MPMQNKLPKFFDNHKICIICEGNEEYEYLNNHSVGRNNHCNLYKNMPHIQMKLKQNKLI